MLTGTLSTGLALLREVDSSFNSPASESLVWASGVALPIGIPLLILLNVPIVGYKTSNPSLYLITLLILVAYLFVLLLFLLLPGFKNRKKANK